MTTPDNTPGGKRILLVEDHEDTLRVMRRLLQVSGYDVTPANSVSSALHAAENNTFDLVVSDVGLPDGSGIDLMRQLKQRYNLRGIALTGYGSDEDVQRSAEAGFVTHLTKPIDMTQMQTAVRNALT